MTTLRQHGAVSGWDSTEEYWEDVIKFLDVQLHVNTDPSTSVQILDEISESETANLALPRQKNELETRVLQTRYSNGAVCSLEPKSPAQPAHILENTRQELCRKLEKSRQKFSGKLKEPILRLHRLQLFPCSYCDSIFFSRCRQETHYDTAHTRERELLTCQICSWVSSSKGVLSRHMWTHRDPSFPCHLCGKLFKQKRILDYHLNKCHHRNSVAIQEQIGSPEMVSPVTADPDPVISNLGMNMDRLTITRPPVSSSSLLMDSPALAAPVMTGPGISSLPRYNPGMAGPGLSSLPVAGAAMIGPVLSNLSMTRPVKAGPAFSSTPRTDPVVTGPGLSRLPMAGHVMVMTDGPLVSSLPMHNTVPVMTGPIVSSSSRFMDCPVTSGPIASSLLMESPLMASLLMAPSITRTQHGQSSGDRSRILPKPVNPDQERKYTCPMCPETFVHSFQLERHMALDTSPSHGGGILSVSCPTCKLLFTTSAFALHSQYCVPQSNTSASSSIPQLSDQDSWSTQLRSMLSEKSENLIPAPPPLSNLSSYQCDICGSLFARATFVAEHKRLAHSNACLLCGKSYEGGLQEHIDREHSISAQTPLSQHECELCGSFFPDSTRLKEHKVSSHSMTLEKCYFCDYTFFNREKLRSHIAKKHQNLNGDLEALSNVGIQQKNLHSMGKVIPGNFNFSRRLGFKETPHSGFECEICGTTFWSQASLTKHKSRTHSAKTRGRHVCEICSATFEQLDYLKQHVRNVHLRRNRAECDICGTILATSAGLRIHKLNVHSATAGDENETEPMVEPGIDQPDGLTEPKKHKKHRRRTHRTEPNDQVQCELRTKAVPHQEYLQQHFLNTHHKGHLTECLICGVRVNRSSLSIHREKFHGEAPSDETLAQPEQTERPYECGICGATFRIQKGLNIHKRRIHKITNPAQKSFSDSGPLRHHVDRVHRKLKRVECQTCESSVDCRSLKRHMAKYHDKTSDANQEPGNPAITFPDAQMSAELDQLAHHQPERFPCDSCPATLGCQSSLDAHRYQTHELSQNPEFQCDICSKTFSRAGYLLQHVRSTHLRLYKTSCDICGAILVNGQKLLRHKAVVHNIFAQIDPRNSTLGLKRRKADPFANLQEKEHECDICGAAFGLKVGLNNHRRQAHKIKNQHRCEFCPKSFSGPASLKLHVGTTHLLKLNKVECEACGILIDRRLLKGHKETVHNMIGVLEVEPLNETVILPGTQQAAKSTHHSRKALECDTCGATFRFKCRLDKHKQKHEARAHKLKCDFCAKGFLDQDGLNAHVNNIHLKVHMVKCKICGILVIRHLLKNHREDVHSMTSGDNQPLSQAESEQEVPTVPATSSPVCLQELEPFVGPKPNKRKCEICGRAFKHKTGLDAHKRRMHEVKKYDIKCDFCSKMFFDAAYLKAHVNFAHLKRHKIECQICGKLVDGRRNRLHRHMEQCRQHNMTVNENEPFFQAEPSCSTQESNPLGMYSPTETTWQY